ncbi:phosphatase PAP2 family protein [Tenacibaculum adriaticum]|uniref:phosphatase PAP2 family protein n=1 Tax=Tenacibaculum adriaticum TaxID=413713 RepID=UPI0014781303|nr:phosphatase PAP2 family protein [Tenacibaculum adriaticum]
MGDGIMFGVLTIIFFFVKKKMSLVFAISGVLTLLITHFFKKIIFKGIPRPARCFGADELHLVEGVKMAFWNSFPSGHTTTAFAIFTILCLYFSKCKSQYLWVSLAVIAGLSRVYLSQHFLMDIFVGSFIGIIIGFLSMGLFSHIKQRVH